MPLLKPSSAQDCAVLARVRDKRLGPFVGVEGAGVHAVGIRKLEPNVSQGSVFCRGGGDQGENQKGPLILSNPRMPYSFLSCIRAYQPLSWALVGFRVPSVEASFKVPPAHI